MSDYIPELTTRVKVTTDTSELDNAINILKSDTLGEISNLTEPLETVKNKLTNFEGAIAGTIATELQSNQEIIISTKHYISGKMVNSVDIFSEGKEYIVTNTAVSENGFPYPLAINSGSSAHWIAPKDASVLHWEKNGTDYYSKGHMVSGIKPDPYVKYSIDYTMRQVEGIVTEFLNNLL